ncbi:hypothetical protein ACFXK0_21260 [Nocardia sp. NPDC059177]|uniref:DUF7373 family lipoprotein n=1 Tax=Nocardia sp. NPDC059177 TaxID=3346759 RepID=UPI00368EC797
MVRSGLFPHANKALISAAIVSLAFVLSSCGSEIDGTPLAGEIDVRTLDVGTYSTVPVDQVDEYSPNYSSGRELASFRLADHLILGTDIDPKLSYGFWKSIPRPSAATNVTKAVISTLEANRMLYGFGTASSDQVNYTTFALAPGDFVLADIQRNLKPTYFGLTVFQFPDADAATRAAADMERADFDVDPNANQQVQISKHPSAHAHWRPGVPTMLTTISRGSYVINLLVGTAEPELPQLTAFAEKILDAQLPKLDGVSPLSPMEILKLSEDPDKILRRALNPEQLTVPDPEKFATYGLQGFFHMRRDQAERRAMYEQVGADRFGFVWGTQVIRTRDAKAAESLASTVLDGPKTGPADAPPGIPNAKCVENKETSLTVKRFSCAVSYRRYVDIVQSHQLTDAHQRAAATFAVMANSQ